VAEGAGGLSRAAFRTSHEAVIIVEVKREFISDIREGSEIDAPFMIENAELRERKGGKYILLSVADRTGKLGCKVWGTQESKPSEMEALCCAIRSGEIYRIRGYAKVYNGSCEINVNDGIADLCSPVQQVKVDPADYIFSPVNHEEVKARLQDIIHTIEDTDLQALVNAALTDAEGFYEKPAAKFRHHDYPGGLAEHTLEAARIAGADACGIGRNNMSLDLLLAGAVLHDIGKVPCFERRGLSFAALPEYDLIGHITLGMNMIARYRSFTDPVTFCHLQHIIQSHHGPHGEVLPRTPEAWAVHLADLTSAKIREVADDISMLKPGERAAKGARSGEAVYRF